ncbi:unnamed protein product [Darwinula stevensoni]|uniref:Nuclear receptor coactivator 2 n=1 Tax=Darwinula stevensoni TaxID=69355 RepID=A0A7R8WYA2_9CRUS|nr:unnamed protein product [Darwinula stevensoni]CAG0878825.1 unnamed protein product [Darwinula stevensoni]
MFMGSQQLLQHSTDFPGPLFSLLPNDATCLDSYDGGGGEGGEPSIGSGSSATSTGTNCPTWRKMSTALPNPNNTKSKNKKKPSEHGKSSSQASKCQNEKKRREQENVYYEELAELVTNLMEDMNTRSVKPDKCAILQETVNQIRQIRSQEPGDGDAAVQQGEVSSSKPAILGNEVLGPLLLEALDGFLYIVNTEGKVEFVSDNVSQFLHYTQEELCGKSIYNILHHGDHGRFSSYLLPAAIGWTSSETSSQSKNRLFNCRFLVKPVDDSEEDLGEMGTHSHGEKLGATAPGPSTPSAPVYDNMQITAHLLPFRGDHSGPHKRHDSSASSPSSPSNQPDLSPPDTSGESQNYLLCIVRRIPPSEKSQGPTVEQFTTRLDMTGKIMNIDTSGVSSTYSQYLNKALIGCMIQELCHPNDVTKLANHLKEALTQGGAISPVYRLRVASDKYLHVQTKSKRFAHNPVTHEQEFLNATHTVIGDPDMLKGQAGQVAGMLGEASALMAAVPGVSNPRPGPSLQLNGPSTSSFNVGSTSVMVNSNVAGTYSNPSSVGSAGRHTPAAPMGPEPAITMTPPSNTVSFSTSFEFSLGELSFEPMPWDMESVPSSPQQETKAWGSGNPPLSAAMIRPNSRQSSNAATPRPPSESGFSPSDYLSSQSPAGHPQTPFGAGFAFSPIQEMNSMERLKVSSAALDTSDKDGGGERVTKSAGNSSVVAESADSNTGSGRLRDLLTQPPSSVDSASERDGSEESSRNPSGDESRNHILKVLLRQEDDDGLREQEGVGKGSVGPGTPGSHREGIGGGSQGAPSRIGGSLNPSPLSNSSMEYRNQAGPHMLLKLLNEKSEEEEGGRGGTRQPNQILSRLLKEDEERSSSHDTQTVEHLLQLIQASEEGPVSGNSDGASGANGEGTPQRGTKRPAAPNDWSSHPQSPSTAPPPSKIPTMELSPASVGSGSGGSSGGSVSVGPGGNSATTKSSIYNRNKMLVALLSRQPLQSSSVPTSVAQPKVSQLPQEKLPKDLREKIISTPSSSGNPHSAPNVLYSPVAPLWTQGSTPRQPFPSSSVNVTASGGFLQNQVGGGGMPRAIGHIGQRTLTVAQSQAQSYLNAILNQPLSDGGVRTSTPSSQSFQNIHTQVSSSGYSSESTSSSISTSVGSSQPQPDTSTSIGGGMAGAEPSSSQQPHSDPLLSEILDQVFSLQQELNYQGGSDESASLLKMLDEVLEPSSTSSVVTASPASSTLGLGLGMGSPSSVSHVGPDERHAISIIQKSLMSLEGSVTTSTPTPSFSMNSGQLPTSGTVSGYNSAPPPNYPQQRFPRAQGQFHISGVPDSSLRQNPSIRSAVSQQQAHQQQHQAHQQRMKFLQEQQARLYRQQAKQQVLMPSSSPSPGAEHSFTSLDDLVNNSIPPNVTVQRSSSMPDSQLSPSYATTSVSREAGRVLGPSPSQISPSNRVGVGTAPSFSPTHSFSTQGGNLGTFSGGTGGSGNVGGGGGVGGGGAQARISPAYNPQLSPRVVQTSQGSYGGLSSPSPGGLSQVSPSSPSPRSSWSPRPPPGPIQQQNPMLNAQLSSVKYFEKEILQSQAPSTPGPRYPGTGGNPGRPPNLVSLPRGGTRYPGTAPTSSAGPPDPLRAYGPQRLHRTLSTPSQVGAPPG